MRQVHIGSIFLVALVIGFLSVGTLPAQNSIKVKWRSADAPPERVSLLRPVALVSRSKAPTPAPRPRIVRAQGVLMPPPSPVHPEFIHPGPIHSGPIPHGTIMHPPVHPGTMHPPVWISSPASPCIDGSCPAPSTPIPFPCPNCKKPCPPYRWFGGGGVYYIQPRFEHNPAFRVATPAAMPQHAANADFEWDNEIAYYGYGGVYFPNGLGVRGRYVGFDNKDARRGLAVPANAQAQSARPLGLGLNAGAGLGVETSSRLDLDTIDVEFIKKWEIGCLTIEGGGGLRYGQLSQSYLFRTSPVNVVHSEHDFEGFGPVFSVEGRYRFGNTGLSAFAGTRIAILFGEEDQTARRQVPGLLQTRQNFSDGIMPISEIELGLRYETCWGHIRPFVEIAGIGHVWWGAGNASNSHVSTAAGDGGFDDSNLGFVGGRVTLGFRY